MTVDFKKIAKGFIRFIVEHHFMLLLFLLLVFIAYAGLIFWNNVYSVITSPVTPLPLPSISRSLFEELRSDLLERSVSLEQVITSTYSNLFVQ